MRKLTTRQRLLKEGIELFATQGYTATTVGEIEAAAGLAPRRGGLYRHFSSKQALLEEALNAHISDIATAVATMTPIEIPTGEQLRIFVETLGIWLLGELDRQENITRILEQSDAELGALRAAMRTEISDPGYLAAASVIRSMRPAVDADAAAVLLVGALINLRRSTWTWGQRPLGVSDLATIAAWVDIAVAWLTAIAPDPNHVSITSYSEQPQTTGEVDWTDSATAMMIAEEPW